MTAARVRSSRPQLVRAALAGLFALAGAVAASLGQIRATDRDPATLTERVAGYAGAGAILVFGFLAVRALASAVQRAAPPRPPGAATLPLARVVTAAGNVIVLLWTLGTLGVGIEALLLGGALTGVVLGIAAQQTLGNVFAGIVLLGVRPFTIGRPAVIKSSLGEYEGTVTDMGLFYVTLETARGRVELPNAVALASAVGPGVRTGPPGDD